jgi:hypothetical protein
MKIKEMDMKSIRISETNKRLFEVAGLLLGFVIMSSMNVWAAGAFDTLSEQTIVSKIGNVIKLIAGIGAILVTSIGLLVGGFKALNGAEDSLQWIKGGIFGGFLCAGSWALANLFISVMK